MVLITLWTLLTANSAAAVGDPDPTALLVDRALRAEQRHTPFGRGDRSTLARAQQLGWEGETELGEAARSQLEPEMAALRHVGDWQARTLWWGWGAHTSLGELSPDTAHGDEEPGFISLRATGALATYLGPASFSFVPRAGLDLLDGVEPDVEIEDAWLAIGGDGAHFGAGVRSRWLGPGRRGSLILTDNALPMPGATTGWSGKLPGRLGVASADVGAGVVDRGRGDVTRPGWLLMDYRWAPVWWLELGASRLGLFGGVDRPMPSIGQLLLPTDPHVYDDPEQEEPDQDELAALDVRLTLPMESFSSLDHVEVWWQYGGEDVIARRSLGIPYPALAGVANLYGLEVARGPLSVTVESARLLDDYFRWYTGHRIYHEGFTRQSRSMGHPYGGDAMGTWVALRWLEPEWGIEVSAEQQTRVGVVESLGENLMALATDESTRTGAVHLWKSDTRGGWWTGGLALSRGEGVDFVPGAQSTDWRVVFGRRAR